MKAIDKIALKYITAQASLNEMIAVNKSLLEQVETLIAINKNICNYRKNASKKN